MNSLPYEDCNSHTNLAKQPNRCDRSMVIQTLQLILEPGQITELRVLDAETSSYRRPHIESGYYDNIGDLADVVMKFDKAKGCYFIPNPINPALLARSVNSIRSVGNNPTTSDRDIHSRRWLLIDADPVRPTGISSTDKEHAEAIARCREVRGYLLSQGWPKPIIADSSNGAHLLYRIDLPTHDNGLVERRLHAIAFRFSDHCVDIDRRVFNPARLLKLYGTIAAKGDHTQDRPHRLAKLLDTPSVLEPVDTNLLEQLADSHPALPLSAPKSGSGTGQNQFSIEHWIVDHDMDVIGQSPWQSGRKWVFRTCPWNPDHTNRSAYIVQFPSGAIAAGCHHNSCAGNNWHALRDHIEPGWRQKSPSQPGGCNTSGPKTNPTDWPDPQTLPDELPPVMPFDFSLLPDAVSPWIEDIAQRIQCPPDFPAVAVVVALAGVVGRKVGIRPKRRDDWLVVPNLWGAVIGRPGIMKTPAIQEPLKPLKRLEIEAKQEFEKLQDKYQAASLMAEEREKLAKAEIRKAIKSGEEETAANVALKLSEDKPHMPIRQRYLVNDSTVEKLGELLNENPNGLLVYRDELVGFLRSLDKNGQEGARAFHLEAWNGTGRFTYDRIGRGTIDIEAAIESIIGAIQPGPLNAYQLEAIRRGKGDDGLIQRFQLAVYPDVSPNWVNVDQWPDTEAKNRAYEVFASLDSLDPLSLDTICDQNDPDGIPYLNFDEEAQDAFDKWRAGLEHQIRSGDEHPAIESHLAKYRSLIPSLALLIHLADGGKGPVGLPAIQKAIRWGLYLESHARRIYAAAINPIAAAGKTLAKHILKHELQDGFALKDVYRPCWAGLSSRDEAAAAVDLLIDLDWLSEQHEPTEGRTKTRYWINPKIWDTPQRQAAKTAKSPQPDLSAVMAVPDEGVSVKKTGEQPDAREVVVI